ncbi:hypothetical protein [Myroides profundi]|uniref:Uncharacterized protein n=1 Tax=Myroides profundi TaxID=480520 RepID=A0AAJ4W501_MYRPR|nr:hypothetical protein [Myroides profundi]SER16550.1 hypothetical protein SAMN04488089_11056 [Myroides profundi]
MIKDYLNKLVGIRLKGRKKELILGIVLAYNDKWLLTKCNSVDYIIDGYELIAVDKISTIERGENIAFIEEVLKAKHVDFYSSPIQLKDNIFDTLKDIGNKYGAFGLEFKEEDCVYVGKYMDSDDSEYFAFEELSASGEWFEEIEEFKVSKIYKIDFDGDYVESLLLYANRKLSE